MYLKKFNILTSQGNAIVQQIIYEQVCYEQIIYDIAGKSNRAPKGPNPPPRHSFHQNSILTRYPQPN